MWFRKLTCRSCVTALSATDACLPAANCSIVPWKIAKVPSKLSHNVSMYPSASHVNKQVWFASPKNMRQPMRHVCNNLLTRIITTQATYGKRPRVRNSQEAQGSMPKLVELDLVRMYLVPPECLLQPSGSNANFTGTAVWHMRPKLMLQQAKTLW